MATSNSCNDTDSCLELDCSSDSQEWNNIPDITLIYVYLCLPDRDKLNMACTCKNWYRLFSSCVLWRERRIIFNSLAPERTAEKEKKFVEKFGHCLNKLTLGFGTPTFQSCMTISKAVEAFLKRMCSRNDIHLKELDLEHIHMEQHWHFILSRNRLISSLCRMVRKQKFLESAYLSGARMRILDGCRFLDALVKGATAGSLTSLYMEDFFETNVFPFRQPRYVATMSKFSALEHLHLNYKYLSPEILRNMANKLSHTLDSLSIILEGDIRGIEMQPDVWYEFAERCPKVKVGAYLCTTILRGNDLRTAFVRGMPLSECYLTSWVRLGESEERLSAFLHHIAMLYNSTLENFAMFFEHHERVDSELLYMVGRCSQLKDLCIQCRLSADTVIEIMKLHHQGRVTLTSVNLTISDISDDDWRRIYAEKSVLLADIRDFAHVGPNDIGSSIGGSTLSADIDDGDDADEDSSDNDVVQLRLDENNNDAEVIVSDDENDIYEPPADVDEDDLLFMPDGADAGEDVIEDDDDEFLI